MPITLHCACGKMLRVADEHAGKRVKCPGCNVIIATPPPLPRYEVLETEPTRQETASKPIAKPSQVESDGESSYGVSKAEKAADKPKKKPNCCRGVAEDDNPRMGSRRSRARTRAAEATAQRQVYIVGGGLAVVAGLAFAIWGSNESTKVLIAGVVIAFFGLVSLIQGITGNLPDDDE